MPVGEVRVRHLVDPDGVRRIADVDQDAVALAGARGQTDLRERRDVVTGVRDRGRPPGHARGVQGGRRLVLQAVDRAGLGVGEEPGLVHDRRLLGRVERNLDHLDPPPCRVWPGRRIVHAALHGRRRSNAGGAGDVDVDRVRVVGIGHQRVGVGAAAGLDGGHLHGVADVADVEDPDALEAGADGRVGSTIDASPTLLDRHEQQVAVRRQVALSTGADDRRLERRIRRVGDVVDVEAVEASGEGVVAVERQVGVEEAEVARIGRVEETGGAVLVPEQLHVAAGRLGVEPAGAEADPRIALRQHRGRPQACDQGRRDHRPQRPLHTASTTCSGARLSLHPPLLLRERSRCPPRTPAPRRT